MWRDILPLRGRSSSSWHESLPWRGGWIGVERGFVHNNKFLECRSLISVSMQTGGVVESRDNDTIGLLERRWFYPLNAQAYDS